MTRYAVFFIAATAVALAGCYSTTIRSGKDAGATPLEANDRWHSGFLGGTQEASGPYDLPRICPHGCSEIRTETSFASGVVDFTAGIYDPQTVKLTCTAAACEATGERASLSQ